MRGSIAIKMNKSLSLKGASLVEFTDGRLCIRTEDNTLHRVLEFPLEIPKYVIDSEGRVLTEVTSKGVVKREPDLSMVQNNTSNSL
ncbi:hypothetical protein NECID01_1703 [Nematocida sp. AWRm77]|nr:hypothetical protein NECID01_1703 [Nematocida sp. AWRm77]